MPVIGGGIENVPGSGATMSLAIGGNTAGTTSLLSTGTANLIGGSNITLSQNGQSISIIGGGGTGGGATFTLNGTTDSVSLVAGANITLNSGASSITIVGGAGGAAGTNTISASGTSIAGTALSFALAAGNNITLATATAAGSMTVSIAGVASVPNFLLNGSSSSLSISAGAGIGIGQANSTITISASVQTASNSLTALGNTTSSSSGTYTNLLNISGAGIASVGVGNGSITISVPAPTASNFSLNGSSSSLSLVAGPNISFASGASSITISGENAVSIVGLASSTGTLSLISGPGISLSLNGANGQVLIQTSGNYVDGFGISSSTAGGVTQGTTTTATGTILLAAGSNITLSSSAGVITVIGASGGTAAAATIRLTQNLSLQEIGGSIASASGTVTGTAGFGSSLFLQRIYIPGVMNLSEVDLAMAMSFNATSNGAGTMSQSLVLYSFGNSSSLASVVSTSGTFAWQTGTSTSGAVVSLTQFQGGWSVPKIHPFTFASSTIPAGEYVVGNLLNFAQASSTWTVQLLGALASITNSTTLSNVTTTGQTLGSFLSQSSGMSFTTGYQSIAQLALTLDAGTATHASGSGATITTNAAFAYAAAARTLLTASTTSSYFFTGATSIGTGTALSSLSLSTQSIVPQYLTAPSLVYIGTNSTTSAFPSVFIAGLMSTGAIPVAITITGAGITYSGVQAGAQPYFALVGS